MYLLFFLHLQLFLQGTEEMAPGWQIEVFLA